VVGGGYHIAKANCEHDGGCPVVGPYISLIPLSILNAFDSLPVGGILIGFRHKVEQNGYEVSKCKVKEDYLKQ